jgi:hypothetical protein
MFSVAKLVYEPTHFWVSHELTVWEKSKKELISCNNDNFSKGSLTLEGAAGTKTRSAVCLKEGKNYN